MRSLLCIACLALAGCASTYDLRVMPRDSGKTYAGVAEDTGAGEGKISITIEDRTYNGTWVETQPAQARGYVSGGIGFRGRFGMGGFFTLENPDGGATKALLTAADGSGLRCDFSGGQGRSGGGTCRDDKGRVFDVQIRTHRG
jgi:hypothetical protein